jgi:hypothetical protein
MEDLKSVINFAFAEQDNFIPGDLSSSDLSIVARKMVEQAPREGFSHGGSGLNPPAGFQNLVSKTVFNISDGSGYLDLKGMYLTGSFEALATTTGAPGNPIPACLDKGGLFSTIQEIRLRIGNAEIFRQQYFNKSYNISTMPVVSENKVDFIDSRHLDSVADFVGYENVNENLVYTNAGSGYVDATRILTLVGGDLLNTLAVGDQLLINAEGAATARVVGTVTAVLTATTCTVTGLPGDLAAAALGRIVKIKKGYNSTRARVINSGAHRFAWHINQSFFNKDFHLPLPFLLRYGALELDIIWEEAVQAITLARSPDATNVVAYKITDLKLHLPMVYPSAEVIGMHQKLYDEQAIRIPYMRYDAHLFNITGAGLKNINVQTNKNSIQRIFAVQVRTDPSLTPTTDSQTNFSQSNFLKNATLNYQFKIGANQYPDYGVLDASGSDSWLTYEELLRAVNRPFDREQARMCNASGTRIRPAEWAKTNSNKWLIGQSFSKDGTFYSGASARLNNVQFSINCNPTDNTLMLFVYYDCLLSVSKNGGVLIYE